MDSLCAEVQHGTVSEVQEKRLAELTKDVHASISRKRYGI